MQDVVLHRGLLINMPQPGLHGTPGAKSARQLGRDGLKASILELTIRHSSAHQVHVMCKQHASVAELLQEYQRWVG